MKNRFQAIFTSLISIFIGLLFGAIVLKLANINPIDAYKLMWEGSFSQPNYIAYIIIRSTPLILTGLSVAFAFKTGLFNIGTEGQFIVGAMTAAYLGLTINLPSTISIPLIILLSIITSGLYGALAGFLKVRYGVHEVLSTIMLNWIALYLSNYVVFLPGFRRPDTETTQFILPQNSITFFEEWKVSENGLEYLANHPWLQSFLRPSVNAGIFMALVCAFVVWIILNKTTFGFKLKAVGHSVKASEYAGIHSKMKMTQAMMISGALSGLAGACHVLGVSKNIAVLAAHEGYGFDGIAASLIGSNHPMGVVLSSFFLGTLKYSGQKIQSSLEAPSEVITIMIGMIVFFISIPSLLKTLRGRK